MKRKTRRKRRTMPTLAVVVIGRPSQRRGAALGDMDSEPTPFGAVVAEFARRVTKSPLPKW